MIFLTGNSEGKSFELSLKNPIALGHVELRNWSIIKRDLTNKGTGRQTIGTYTESSYS